MPGVGTTATGERRETWLCSASMPSRQCIGWLKAASHLVRVRARARARARVKVRVRVRVGLG